MEVDNIGEGDALLQIRVSRLDRPRLTTIGAVPGKDCVGPKWSPDSRLLAFSCMDEDSWAVYTVAVDPPSIPTVIHQDSLDAVVVPSGFSPDSSYVLAGRRSSPDTIEFITVPVNDSSAGVETVGLDQVLSYGHLSPDGRWLAYLALEAGRVELYVRGLESPTSLGPRVLALPDAPLGFLWSKRILDGGYRLLAYDRDRIVTLEMSADPAPRFSDPTVLDLDPFALGVRALDELPDGRIIAVLMPDSEIGAGELRLVLNWTRELEERLPLNDR